MRETVAQVAVDEPDTALKSAQPKMFTCKSRPGAQASHGARPLKRPSLTRVRNRMSPIQRNIGNAVRVQSLLSPQIAVAATLPTGAAVNQPMAAAPVRS